MPRLPAQMGEVDESRNWNVIHNPDECEAPNASVISDLSGFSKGRCARPKAPVSAKHRANLSAAQFAYCGGDPRWPEHRSKIVAVQTAKRMTLAPEAVLEIIEKRRQGRTLKQISDETSTCVEVIRREMRVHGYNPRDVFRRPRKTLSPGTIRAILKMRQKGLNFEHISTELSISREVIRRELRALGISTRPIKSERRVQRHSNAWQTVLDFDGARAWA